MEDKKPKLVKVALYALSAFSAVTFLWVCFIATGISNGSTEISTFADRLVISDIIVALFSAVFGFSFLVFDSKKLSSSAKRALHMLLCYISFTGCVCSLFASVKDAKVSLWLVLIFFATLAFFLIYGAFMLVKALIRRKNS